MKLADSLVMELGHEAQGARKAIERVPEDKYGWAPHTKSMAAGRLISHVAELPGWLGAIIGQSEFRMDPSQMTPFIAKTRAELLKTFDDNLKAGSAALKGASDAALMQNWKMISGETTIVDMPRIAVVRTWVLNHLIHHRGQLTVYLRLLGAAVPSLYGPSADEQG